MSKIFCTFVIKQTDMTTERIPIEQAIVEYLKKVSISSYFHYKANLSNLTPPEYIYTKGKKFYKVFEKGVASKSVFCFIDFDGNIYKSASWASPAKGIRGSVYQDNPPLAYGQFYIYR